MSVRIIDKKKVPRDKFSFTDPNKGYTFRSHVFGRLVGKVQEYQTANSFRVWPAEEIEEDFCKRYPDLCTNGGARPRGTDDILSRLAIEMAIPAADVLAKLTKKFGINCPTCNRRHRIIRRARELGLAETIRQLKETI